MEEDADFLFALIICTCAHYTQWQLFETGKPAG